MIRINLLGEKVDNSGVYIIESLVVFSAVFVLTIGIYFFHSSQSHDLVELERERDLLTQRVGKLKEETKDVENVERKKKELKEMLMIIAQLKAKKHGPVHLMEEVNIAVPEQAWLVSMQERQGNVELAGFALDNQTVARFMSDLEKSEYIKDDKVGLNQTKLEELEINKKKIKLTSFSISAQLEDMLKLRAAKGKKTESLKVAG